MMTPSLALLFAFALGQDPFEERKLATLPEGEKAKDVRFSPDGRHVVFASTAGGKQFVRVDDTKLEEFDEVRWPDFLSNGKTVTYGARVGKKWRLIVGDRKEDEFDVIFPPEFGENGSSPVYRVKEDGKFFVVVNGKKVGPYDEVDYGIRIGRDGRAVYKARIGKDWFVMDGDRKSGPYEKVGAMRLSPDGGLLIYFTQAGEKERVHVGDRKPEEVDGTGYPEFTPDGKHYGYTVDRGEKHFAVVDGVERPIEGRRIMYFALSPDGKEFAYSSWSADSSRMLIHRGDKVVAEREGSLVRDLQFSADGKHVLWVLATGKGQSACVDDKVGEPFEGVRWLDANAAGDLSFVGRTGKKDGLWVGARKVGDWDFVNTYRWAPDGKTLVWMCESVGRSVVHAGATVEVVDRAFRPLQFSPDGKKVAFGAAQGRELWWRVLEVK